jgi:hypothetical protein
VEIGGRTGGLPTSLVFLGISGLVKRERLAFHRLLPELRLTYPDKFVAIHDGQVVESGADKLEVARLVYDRFGYVPLFVSQVSAATPSPIRMPSARCLDGVSSY